MSIRGRRRPEGRDRMPVCVQARTVLAHRDVLWRTPVLYLRTQIEQAGGHRILISK